mmetsp:Transcript_17623/g.59089  ORF Transcript_17623/g.59089 Transcript_17623/m.59089 type:complete len:299 (+) Transcript_17623:17-913(+)
MMAVPAAGLIALHVLAWHGPSTPVRRSALTSPARMSATDLGLTPELEKIVSTFRVVPDQKLRYQQLLFLAQQSKPLAPALKTPENKVPGCLSTVHVHATLGEGRKVFFQGDSDAMLTKGLVVLLVQGLSGHTPEEIDAVDPKFIQEAGIAASLTPGRNNGLLNMLGLMKQKAKDLGKRAPARAGLDPVAGQDGEAAEGGEEAGDAHLGPVGKQMASKLREKLKPTLLEIVDNSAQHAGHAAREDLADGETHFAVTVEAAVFGQLNKVQRHQLVYAVLQEELKGSVHALQINARAPGEP